MKTYNQQLGMGIVAVLLTASVAPAALISVDVDPFFRATNHDEISGDLRVANIYGSGQNGTDDQIGVWDNGSTTENYWNYVSFSASELRDTFGNVTSVSYATTGIGLANNWQAGAPNDDLVSDGVFGNPNTSLSTTISGLTANGLYNVLVYHADDNPSEVVTINGANESEYTGPSLPSYADATHTNAASYADAFDGITGADFWYFDQVEANESGQLVISSGGSDFNTLTGFQLVLVPEPASLSLMVIGGLLMLRRRIV